MTGGQPENPQGGAEKRGAPRISERCRVSYRAVDQTGDHNPKRVASQTLNLSASGLCLVSSEPIIPDRHVALELRLSDRPEPLMALGRVVWCDRDGEQFRVGICFTWLREEDRRDLGAIADYVARKLDDENG